MPCAEEFEEAHSVSLNNQDLQKQEKEFYDSKKYLSIYILTWNVNGKDPEGSLTDLMAFNHRMYDVYVIALEELPMKILMWTDSWRNYLEEMFRRFGYFLLKKDSLMFTEVFVFVRRKDITKFSHVKSHSVNVANGLSLKGGVGIRFIYDFIKIGFLGAHLTPHDQRYEERIKDQRLLLNEVQFGQDYEKLNSQDLSFILGDLNFRLNPLSDSSDSHSEEDEYNQIVKFVRNHNSDIKNDDRFEPLLKYDQIRYAISKGEGFRDYQEAPITFAPTFKFEVGTCHYDDKRRPAWTDRILWRNLLQLQKQRMKDSKQNEIDELKPKIFYYNSLYEYTISDHKPVRQVAWIPIAEMRKTKLNLVATRRARYAQGKLQADSVPWSHPIGRNFRSVSVSSSSTSSSSSSSSSEGEYIPRVDVRNPEEDFLPNVDVPYLFQPRYSIEFYHIPDWNENKKFYANFRVVKEEEQEDGENPRKRPVSIEDPQVRRYLSVWDWVGLFNEDFLSLENFLTYSYPKFGHAIQAEEAHEALSVLAFGESGSSSSNQNESVSSSNTRRKGIGNAGSGQEQDVLTVYFDESTPILAGKYVLVYVRQNGDVIGISDPFVINRNIDLSSAID